MNSSTKPLNINAHNKLKINEETLISLCENKQILPLDITEFPRSATAFPVIFIKSPETGEFQSVALLGLQKEKSSCVKDGKWVANYIPSCIFNVPFLLSKTNGDDGKMIVSIDENNPVVNETTGYALFEDGEESEFLLRKKDFLIDQYERNQITQHFCKLLASMELFIPRVLTVTDKSNAKHNVDGVYTVNEDKLNELSQDDFSTLRDKNFLTAIYAHLISINNLNKLS
jgi:hypothetical protein